MQPAVDDDIGGGEFAAPVEGEAGELAAQLGIALDIFIQYALVAGIAQGVKHGFFEFGGRQEAERRRGDGEIHEVVGTDIAINGGDHFLHADFAFDGFGFGDPRQAGHAPHIEPDIVTGFRPGFDQSFCFEVVVGLKGGAHADTVFVAEHPDGRQFVADLQDLAGDHFFQSGGQLEIEGVGGPLCARLAGGLLLHG